MSPLIFNVAMSVLDEHLDRPPGGPGPATTSGPSAAPGLPNCRPSATRTTGACSCTAPGRTPRPCAKRSLASRGAGPAAVTRKDPDRAHEQGLDFLGWRIQRHRKRGTGQCYVYTYPAKRRCLDHREGEDAVPPGRRPAPGSTCCTGSTPPCAAGQLLPPRGVQRHLRLPARLRLAPGHRLAAPQHRGAPGRTSAASTTTEAVAPRRGDGLVQPGSGAHHPVPLPGHVSPPRGRRPQPPRGTGPAESPMR